jgi:transcription elongation GreA/GreB family factor
MLRRSGPKKDEGPLYLTEEALQKLKAELERLKRSLPALIGEAQRTAAYGDRSDNAEYKQAKGSLRRANYRILEIEDQLKRVEIITPGTGASGMIELGSTVVLESDGKESVFQILGPHETDPGAGAISHESPLGVALMYKKAGETVSIETPKGTKDYFIQEVR